MLLVTTQLPPATNDDQVVCPIDNTSSSGLYGPYLVGRLVKSSRTDQVWVQECTRQVLETGSIYSQPVWNECVEEGP